MTPRPNAVGYIVLAAFVGAAIYALTGKAKAKPLTASTTCVIDAVKLERWAFSRKVAIVWFGDGDPPSFDMLPDVAKTSTIPILAVTTDGLFFTYTDGAPRESREFQTDYCSFVK